VLMETPTTREIDRMEEPSTSIERIWTRFSWGSLFMPSIYELLCLASSILFHLLHSERFCDIFPFNESPILEIGLDIDETIVGLVAGNAPAKARDLILAWSEKRHSSWADAAREADMRSASGAHVPQLRGQLRYHLGEKALSEASRKAGVGALPYSTTPAGGVFVISRTGKFGLVSLTVREPRMMPRRSISRKMLSQPNEDIDPQIEIFPPDRSDRGAITELAYLGCLIAVPNKRDPSVPAELALGIPNARLTNWLAWMPLHRLISSLQEKVDANEAGDWGATDVTDNVFPRFRIPAQVKEPGADDK
jgi:hypothetical protein